MGIPILANDIGGPYTFPSTPPVTAPATMLSGSLKTFVASRSVMTFGAPAQTTLGTLISGTLFSQKTFVEGSPVHLAGSITNTSVGWLNGILQGSVPNVVIN